MNIFLCKDKDNKSYTETFADDYLQLEEIFKSQNKSLVFAQRAGTLQEKIKIFRGIKNKDLAEFCHYSFLLLESGYEVVDAMQEACSQIDSRLLKAVINKIIFDVKSGKSIKEAAKDFANILPADFTEALGIMEKSNSFNSGMKVLYNKYKKQDELSSRIKKVLSYPILLSFFIVVILLGLCLFLVPQFASILPEAAIRDHYSIYMFLNFGRILQDFPFLSLATFVFVIVTLISFVMHKGESIPIFGALIMDGNIHKMFTELKVLTSCGKSFTESLEFVMSNTKNQRLKSSINDLIKDINNGLKISQGFARIKIFNNRFTKIMSIGEKNGRIDLAIDSICKNLEDSLNRKIEKILAMIQPIFILSLGGIIVWVVVAFMFPIYETVLANVN